MRKGGVISRRFHRVPLFFLVAAHLLLGETSAWGAGLVGGSYTLNWDQKVDKKDTEITESETFKQVLEIKYRGFLKPVVENELSVKVEHERTAEGEDKIRVNPILTLGYKGGHWNAGAKRTVDDSNEPGKNSKITDAYFVEFFFTPPRKTLPDLKAKYNLDKDFEKEITDTSKHAFAASTVYHPMEWIEFKGEYALNRSYDFLRPDADARDDKRSATIGIRQVLADKIKFNTEYTVLVTRGATFLDAGGSTNDKEDQAHTWKNTLVFRPLRDTTFDASYDFDLKQNMVNGEHTFTKNYKAGAGQKIGILDIKGDFTRAVAEPRHTADDNRKTDDTWTADARWKFSKQLDFSLKYQNKSTNEAHFTDPTKSTTSASKIVGGSWTGDLAPFWKASAFFDRTDTYAKGSKTTFDKKYSLKSTFDFRRINLTLDPTYDISLKEDFLVTPSQSSETRDFKFRVAYRVLTTNNFDAKFDHTYGRKTDSLANNIQRTDSTNGNVSWREPFPRWIFGIDVVRTATDTSNDDQPPQVDSSFGIKGDYKRKQFSFSTSYRYDKKRLTYNSELFDAKFGWMAPRWDVSLIYSFNKTFSELLNEGYSINITFKYNL